VKSLIILSLLVVISDSLTSLITLLKREKRINMALSSARGKLIGVIGDEDTCVGFLLGGIGELDKNRRPNFMVVDKNTAISDIEDTLKSFIRRDDIDIILINQNVAEMVRHVLDAHSAPLPAILEIPSKDSPYDANKDSILRRAKGMFSAEDMK